MSSTLTYYQTDYCQYYDVTEVDDCVVVRTHQYGYVYVLSYDANAREYNIVHTTNPVIYPKQ